MKYICICVYVYIYVYILHSYRIIYIYEISHKYIFSYKYLIGQKIHLIEKPEQTLWPTRYIYLQIHITSNILKIKTKSKLRMM